MAILLSTHLGFINLSIAIVPGWLPTAAVIIVFIAIFIIPRIYYSTRERNTATDRKKAESEKKIFHDNLEQISSWFDEKEKTIYVDIRYNNSGKSIIKKKIGVHIIILDEKGYQVGSVTEPLPTPIGVGEKHRIITKIRVDFPVSTFKHTVTVVQL